MSRFPSLERLVIASFASAGLVVACRAAQPGEAPPLAPRPPTATVSHVEPPIFGPSIEPLQARDAGTDAARPDAARPDAAVDAPPPDAGPAPRDARVPDARDGVRLPPVSDASMPLDSARLN